MQTLDVLITASSRPQLIEFCLRSFIEKMHFSGTFRFLLHEDFVFEEQSRAVLRWATRNEVVHFDIIRQAHPAVGLGAAMERMLVRIRSPFMFYLQEDWEFERHVDLDQAIWTMEQTPELNSLIFFKYRTPSTINSFSLEETRFDMLTCSLYNTWSLLPSLWRSSFIKSRWVTRKERPEGFFTNSLGSAAQRMRPEFCRKQLGVYIYGPNGDYRYVRHLGNTWRMAAWRLEDGAPGGNEPGPEFDAKTRAPWLPPMEARPSSKAPTGQYPELSEEPEEVKSYYGV